MLRAPKLLPGGAKGTPSNHLPSHRDDLLSNQDAEQTDESDNRRSRRADIEEAVDDPDQQPSPE
jgi:hypothetical protein